MGPTLTWNFWEFRSYRGPCECLSWSHHVYGDTRRGGFRFPFVGIWAKTAVLAQTGEGPQAVWDNYHGCEEIFELPRRLASGVNREQIVPRHVRLVVERLALSRDGITMQEFFELWRAWQRFPPMERTMDGTSGHHPSQQ